VGLAERVLEVYRSRRGGAELASPVAGAIAPPFEGLTGHAASYDPEKYGQYLATSNEVYSAAALRARHMSSLNLQVFNGSGPERTELTSGPAVDLLRRVNPFWTRRRLDRMDELAMCLWGESFWAVEGALEGNPQEIWWCKPTQMRPVPHPKWYLEKFLYLPLTGGPTIEFAPGEVVWFRYPNPNDEFQSLSPLTAALRAADTGSAMLQANANLFRQGLMAGGLIVPDHDKVTFSKQQQLELEEMLERRWSGVDKAHRWSVLRFEAQLRALNVTPKDAQFVEGLGLMARQVWNALGIPAPLMNDLAYATLSNMREFRQQLWTDALRPDSQLRADEIVQQFLPMFARTRGRPATADHAEFDYSQVPELQQLASEGWDRDRRAIEIGALTINEWRRRQGLPEVAWGDAWWAPVNKSAVTGATSKPQGDTTPTGGNGGDGGNGGGNGQVDQQEAASMMAALELAQMELRHGPFALNGRNGKGHR
jgi:HK97 family phage portal protein